MPSYQTSPNCRVRVWSSDHRNTKFGRASTPVFRQLNTPELLPTLINRGLHHRDAGIFCSSSSFFSVTLYIQLYLHVQTRPDGFRDPQSMERTLLWGHLGETSWVSIPPFRSIISSYKPQVLFFHLSTSIFFPSPILSGDLSIRKWLQKYTDEKNVLEWPPPYFPPIQGDIFGDQKFTWNMNVVTEHKKFRNDQWPSLQDSPIWGDLGKSK